MTTQHKRGDTFSWSGELVATINDARQLDLTGWTGSCQIRRANGQLIETLSFVWLDATQSLCKIESADTENWPLTLAKIDIQITDGAAILSTATTSVNIIEDVTRG